MSIISALFSANKVSSFEEVYKEKDVTSGRMKSAIKRWFDLYFEGDTPEKEDDCQRLPVLIVNKLVKTTFSEYVANVTGKGQKADFITGLLSELDAVKGTAMQQALIGGECFIKPILYGKGFSFSVIRRDCYVPLARNSRGDVISVGTAEFTTVGNQYYTLLERR
ncbi:MAG: hypothetical protein RSF86_14565, partial [Angelakisella sp.]